MRSFLALIIIFNLFGCASVKRVFYPYEDPTPQGAVAAPKLYQAGVAALQRQEYAIALADFDRFRSEESPTRYSQVSVYNSGVALEGLQNWEEARRRYRQVIGATDMKNTPRLQVLAIYRLSFCNEALGDDAGTIAALTDAMNRRSFLPREVGRAELPARLASAYSRIGNYDRALEFYAEAEKSLTALRREADPKNLPDWLGETLFHMGHMAIRKITWADYDGLIRPLRRAQYYLLQAAETGIQPWSMRASDEAIGLYSELWSAIENVPAVSSDEDPVMVRRTLQERQWEMAANLIETIRDLRVYQLPQEKSPGEAIDKIFTFTKDLENRAFALLSQRPAGEERTAESQARLDKIRGRVVAPNDSLEKEYQKQRKNLPVKKKPVEDESDPNI